MGTVASGTGTSTTLSHSTAVMYTVQDFAVNVSPTSVVAVVGSTGSSTITVSSLNGFTGTVMLSASASASAGLYCSLSTSNIALGTSGTSLLQCSGTGGIYNVTITGTDTNSGIAHTATIAFTIRDFSLSPNTLILSGTVNSAVNSTLTLTGLGGFSGNVALTGTVTQESVQSGGGFGGGSRPLMNLPPASIPAISFSPTSVTLGAGSVIVFLTVSSSYGVTPGLYTVLLVATGGGVYRTVGLTLTVTDFSLAANPSTLSILPGGSGNSTIIIVSLSAFQGNITLAVSVSPGGPSVTLNTTSLFLTSGGTSAVLLVVSVPQSTPNGNYTITILASSGSVSHSVTVILVVRNALSTGLLRFVNSQDSVPLVMLGLFSMMVLLSRITNRTGPKRCRSLANGNPTRIQASPRPVVHNLQFAGAGWVSTSSRMSALERPFD